MIYKPRCEYAHAERKTGALHCSKLNGYCAFQYRCEQTGQWENTPTAKGCKARNKVEKKETSDQSSKGVNEISKAFENLEQAAQKSTMSLNEVAYAISDAAEKSKITIEPVSERRKVTDEVEQSEHKTARRASGNKRGRRKKRDDVPSDAAQASTGKPVSERMHPESGTFSE